MLFDESIVSYVQWRKDNCDSLLIVQTFLFALISPIGKRHCENNFNVTWFRDFLVNETGDRFERIATVWIVCRFESLWVRPRKYKKYVHQKKKKKKIHFSVSVESTLISRADSPIRRFTTLNKILLRSVFPRDCTKMTEIESSFLHSC